MANPDRDQQGEERHEEDRFPVIGIIGPIASGKDTIAKILKDNFGVAQFTISDNLKRLAATRDVVPPYSRDLLWDISLEIIDKLGPGGNVKFTKELIETQRALTKMQGATIDGIRHQSDVEYFKKITGSLLIAVNAPQTIRFDRYLHRENEGDVTFYDEFLKRDNMENAQIQPNFLLADIKIDNSGTLEELEAKVIEFFIDNTNVF